MRLGKLAPGCLLMLSVGVVLLISTIVLLWVGNAQFQKIREFTQTTPQWTEVVHLEDAQRAQVDARIRAFILGLDEARDVAILLSPEELAQAIALYKPLEPLRSTVTPREIVKNEAGQYLLRADICFELHAMLPWQQQPYLNGIADMSVSTSFEQGGPRIELVAVKPVVGEMQEKMLEVMNQMDPFLGGLRDEIREPRGSAALEMIQYVEIRPEGVVLATNEAAAKSINAGEVREN